MLRGDQDLVRQTLLNHDTRIHEDHSIGRLPLTLGSKTNPLMATAHKFPKQTGWTSSSFFGDFLATRSLASALAFAGFAPRRIGAS
jgi:hypothetical protein